MVSLSQYKTTLSVSETEPKSSLFFSLYYKVNNFIKVKKKTLLLCISLCITVFILVKPQSFVNLWLTPDQQGQLLFNLGKYSKAAEAFKNTKWQAYSQYGAENFKQAATLYSQFDDIDSTLSQANAYAQDRRYVKAKGVYADILTRDPDNTTAKNNLAIVQAIIDEVNRYSESQQAESGDSPKELGDAPQTGDGADEKLVEQKVEQLSSEQLLLDPALNEMWLRQVQKNPARFLSQKFYMQNELLDKKPATSPQGANSNGEVQ